MLYLEIGKCFYSIVVSDKSRILGASLFVQFM